MTEKYKEYFEIRGYELDLNNRVFASSLFDYLQQVATNQASKLGFGYFDIKEQGTFWVLARNHLRVDRYPVYGEKLRVETWPKGTSKSMALRDYIIYDEDNKEIGRATSSWVLLDIKRHRPVRPPKDLPGVIEEDAIETIPTKINTPDSLRESYRYKVGYSDCDINGHVNNVNYIRWIQNIFSVEQYNTGIIKEIKANFLCECAIGHDLVISYKQINDTMWYVEVFNESLNKAALKSEVYWTNK